MGGEPRGKWPGAAGRFQHSAIGPVVFAETPTPNPAPVSSGADVFSPEAKAHTAQEGSTNANGFTNYFDRDGLLAEKHKLIHQYVSNTYTDQGASGQQETLNWFYPQATRNYLASVGLKF